MLITMKPGQNIAGPDVVHRGKYLYELPDAQGAAVVAAGHAEQIAPDPEAEAEAGSEAGSAPDPDQGDDQGKAKGRKAKG